MIRRGPMAEALGVDGTGPGGAVVAGAERKPEGKPHVAEVKVEVPAPKPVEVKVEPATRPDPKPEPKPEIVAPVAVDAALAQRLDAIERRAADDRRALTVAHVKGQGCTLTDAQIRQYAPVVDPSTPEGVAALDKWREGNGNFFAAHAPRPDQIAADLASKIITDKTSPAEAERAKRLMKSLWRPR